MASRAAYLALYRLVGPAGPAARRQVRRRLPEMEMTVDGLCLRLCPADNTTEFNIFKKGRLPEAETLARLAALVSGHRCLFFDIGMNAGLYTLALAPRMAPGSRVIGFEPNPILVARARRNLALNGLEAMTRIEQVALGPRRGRARLAIGGHDMGSGSLRSDHGARRIEVETRVITEYLGDADPSAFFVVKVDVEGYEDGVLGPLLTGNAPRRPDALLIETVHRNLWTSDLEGALTAAGYRAVFSAEGNTLYVTEEIARADGGRRVDARMPSPVGA